MLKRTKLFASVACLIQAASFLLLYIFSSKKKGAGNYLIVSLAGLAAGVSLYSSYKKDAHRSKRKTAMDNYFADNGDADTPEKESTLILDDKIDSEAFPDIDTLEEDFLNFEDDDEDFIECENEITEE